MMRAPSLAAIYAAELARAGMTMGKALEPAAIAQPILNALGRAPLRIVGSPGLLEAALEIAVAFQRSVYDSLYVALALARGCVLITADHRLAKALAAGPLGSSIQSLGEWEPMTERRT